MTISTQTRTAGPFTTNGSTTAFPFAFKCFAASDIVVVRRVTATGVESNLVLNTDYTVSLNTNQDANPGGTVNTIGALGAGFTLTLTTNLQYLQPTDLTNQGGFYPKVITTALDRLTIFTQQLAGLANRALKFPISDGNLDATLPGKDQRKGRLLAFHETTGLPVAGPTISDTATVGDNIAAIKTVADNIADVNIVADYADEVANFNATYQGPKATDPTLRNDGTALQEGDLYFNTNTDRLRAYTGSRWSEANTGAVAVQRFTGDGTTVSFQLNAAPDNENVVQVFIGGVYQSKTVYDLTGTNSDILTFVSAPPNGVTIEAVTFSVLPLGVVDASQVQMAGGGTLDQLANADSQVLIAAIKALDLGRKYGEFVLVEDYANLVTAGDWTVAWNTALATGKNVAGTRGVEYKVTGKLFCTNNQFVDLRGASIRQYTDQTPIFDAVNKAGVTITGGKLFGKAEASYLNSASSLAIGVLGTGATNLKVYDMEFDGFYYSPLMVASGGTNIYYFDNIVAGIPSVLAVDGNRRNTTGATIIGSRVFVTGNDIQGTASGLIIGQGSSSVVVANNIIHDLVNEHGIYADTGIRRLSIVDNIIYNTGASGTGLKVQYYDAFGVAPQYTTIRGNTIINTGTDGILVYNSSGTTRLAVLIVSDNIVVNAGAYGLNVRDTDDATINSNNVVNCAQAGIAYGRSGNIDIVSNKIRGCGASGIRDLVAASAGVTIINNKIYNPATSNIVGDEFGILVATASTDVAIRNNKIVDSSSNCQYGVYIQQDINAELSLTDNETQGMSDTGVRFSNTGALKEYKGNKWNGALAPAFNGPALPSVASAATIYIPQAHDVFKVTGTTNISTIEATGNAGRRITMIFTGTLTVALSGNIKLNAGAFAAAADKSLTLVSDGTFWYG